LFEKCHVDDVTVGGASVVSTSGYLFLVGHNLNRSTFSGDFLGNAYFWSEKILRHHFGRVLMGLAVAVTFLTNIA